MTKSARSAAERIIVDRDVDCPMRDGTVLRGDVYRPEHGAHPVLICRTPYGKDHPLSVTNLMFPPIVAAERGYAVVVQDVRGRFASDGTWSPLICEGDDSYDTVEWAAAQSWSTGSVGLYGSSYMGVTTLQGVAAAPPHLRAAAAYLTGGDYHDGWVYSGGAFELLFNLRWTAGQALVELHRFEFDGEGREEARRRLQWIADEPHAAMRFTPLEDIFAPLDHVVPYWREWLSHPAYDDYWEAVDLTKSLSRARVPVLNIAGWYDGFLGGHLDVCRTMDEVAKHNPQVRHEIILGPWDHESYQGMRPNAAGDSFFGSQAVSGAAGLSERFLGWFDRWLRPQEATTSTTDADRVQYFHMGPNEWRNAQTWPPGHDPTVLFLTSAGAANTSDGDGQLAAETGARDVVDSFVHDPRDPVPTCGGRHLGYWYGRAGVQDQSTVELRSDVLCYTSPLLTDPLDVSGAVRVRLHVRSSAAHTDFTAKLVDVRPDGYCANIAEGIRRITLADGDLRGDEPLAVDIDLWDTSYQFDTGHRIRVEIASTNFPRFDRNGNQPATPSATAESEWTTAVQQVFAGPRYPSALHLGEARASKEVR